MQQSQSIGALVAAVAKAQQEIRNPALDKAHPHFKGFKYASLGSHIDAIREPFARNGLMISQGVNSDDMRVSVTTLIAHTSGEWMSSTVGMTLAEKATAQTLGACVTYLRRYALAAMCLLTGDDDTDAEEDRETKVERPPVRASQRDVFDPTPVNAAPVAARPPAKSWPDDGRDVVIVEKIVPRGETNAVLCRHATQGACWVSVPVAGNMPLGVGDRIELSWKFNHKGDKPFAEAVEIGVPPTLKSIRKEQEIPF